MSWLHTHNYNIIITLRSESSLDYKYQASLE